jgi:hypothetical protein
MTKLAVMITMPVPMTLVMKEKDANILQLIMMIMTNVLMITVAQLMELPILTNQFLLMMPAQL